MATAAELAGQIASYDQNKVTSEGALNDAMKQYGIPEIRQNVAGLRTTVANTTSALNNVDPSVTGRTQGSLVTEAQRQRQVVNERAPIAGQLQDFTGKLGDSEKNLAENTNLATTTATNKVNDYNTGRAALQSQYDNTYKAEQDAATREAQRQQQAAAQAENDRNYQLAVQNANTNAYKASSSGGKVSAGDTKAAVTQHIASSLASNTGKDGKVSNETFAAALNDWQSVGGTVRDFWKAYGRYTNPKYVSSYAGYAQR